MKENNKPKYGVPQNVLWMIQTAWGSRKRTLLFCLLTATLEVLLNVVQLYLAPEVLSKVERRVSPLELLATIGIFTAALFLIRGAMAYIQENTLFARVNVRSAIIGKVAAKCNETSYPNTLRESFTKLRAKAYQSCQGNNEAAEHIWQTLTMLPGISDHSVPAGSCPPAGGHCHLHFGLSGFQTRQQLALSAPGGGRDLLPKEAVHPQ